MVDTKLTINDLIIEYMIYKVKNGYKPSFTGKELSDFLKYSKKRIPFSGEDVNISETLSSFFDYELRTHWNIFDIEEGKSKPHMDIKYDKSINDYVVSANYRLSEYDRSVINTYFMNGGHESYEAAKGEVGKIRSVIDDYLKNEPKRKIDYEVFATSKELKIAKYKSAIIIKQIWLNYIKKLIINNMYPKQCDDFKKYCLDMDLLEVIGLDSIKTDLLDLYKELVNRISILYHEDNRLKVSSYTNGYLAHANYKLMIEDYENIFDQVFGPYKLALEFDLGDESSINNKNINTDKNSKLLAKTLDNAAFNNITSR